MRVRQDARRVRLPTYRAISTRSHGLVARDTSRGFSETVVDLIRRGLRETRATRIERSPVTGLW